MTSNPAPATADKTAIEDFASRAAAAGARVHTVDTQAAAIELVGELVGEDSWCGWQDPLLDTLELRGRRTDPEAAEFSLIRADLGIAATGTLVCAHGAGRPRAVGLLPAHQIAVLNATDLVADVATALNRFFGGGDPTQIPANLVFITGPSKTADIELHPLTGVHSPKEIDVVLIT